MHMHRGVFLVSGADQWLAEMEQSVSAKNVCAVRPDAQTAAGEFFDISMNRNTRFDLSKTEHFY